MDESEARLELTLAQQLVDSGVSKVHAQMNLVKELSRSGQDTAQARATFDTLLASLKLAYEALAHARACWEAHRFGRFSASAASPTRFQSDRR